MLGYYQSQASQRSANTVSTMDPDYVLHQAGLTFADVDPQEVHPETIAMMAAAAHKGDDDQDAPWRD